MKSGLGNLLVDKIPLTPKGGGVRILASAFQNLLINCINGFRVISVVIPGATPGTAKQADIKSTEFGTIITLPAGLGTAFCETAWPPTIYSTANSYPVGAWVWVQSTNTIVTTGATYPPTGTTQLSRAGLWRCVRGAAAGVFPIIPYPSSDDPTASTMYWLYFGNVYCA